MLLSPFERVVRIITTIAIGFSSLSPLTAAASPLSQSESPTVTATPNPTPTETIEATPTATVIITPTATLTPALTAGPPAPTTVTLTPTVAISPTATTPLTPTDTPFPSPTASPTLTPTLTATASPTLTPTATITPTSQPISLTLTMEVAPAFANPGAPVTVTLTLSNPTLLDIDNLSLSATLPAEIGYTTPLGGPTIPRYNPLLRLLKWEQLYLPAHGVMTLSYGGQVAPAALPGPVTLAAEALQPQLQSPVQAQTGLTVAQLGPTPTPTPAFTPILPGPPARIQVGIKMVESRQPGAHQYWLAVYVVDSDGLAVADGTEVEVTIRGRQTRLQTRQGIATTRFEAVSGQPLEIAARAGTIQETLHLDGAASSPASQWLNRQIAGQYNDAAQAIVRARNAVRLDGQVLRAENQTRRVDFDQGRLTFHLKAQERTLKALDARQPLDEQLTVSFELTDIRVGAQSLFPTSPQQSAEGNWVTYGANDTGWQMLHEVSDAAVEQYFVFEKGTPTDGDLVIEGQFESRLQPIFLSNEAGIRFMPAGQQIEEGGGLAYGPALVADAIGRQLLAQLELDDKRLRITIPAVWLAQAEFPVIVDPIIGSPEVVSQLPQSAIDPAVASDGANFLSVWSWQGDIYGQLVDANGVLSGTLISLSQADGSQNKPAITYNQATGEYLVVWRDSRYGATYKSLWGQRVSPGGQLVGDELMLLPPTRPSVDDPALAVSSAGDYLLVWWDTSGGNNRDIFGQMLSQSGTISGTVLTISSANNVQESPGVAYDSQADVFLVVWEDKRSGVLEVYGQRVSSGGSLLDQNQLMADGGDTDSDPAVASNGNGQFLVAWRRTLAGVTSVQSLRLTAATGQQVGSVLTVDPSSGSAVSMTGISGHRYLVFWRNSSQVKARQMDSAGGLGSVMTLRSGGALNGTPAVAHAASNNQALGIWEDRNYTANYVIAGQRIEDAGEGSANGGNFAISPYLGQPEYVTAAAGNPATAPTGHEFMLAWQQLDGLSGPDILAQPVDSQGQATGAPLNLTHHPAAQIQLDLAAGVNDYLVVWRDQRNASTSGADIYGYLLTPTGIPSGTLIAISTAANDQSYPALAYNRRRNEYLVVWDDYRNGTDKDIYGQIVRADGSLGNSFGLTVAGPQGFPEVAYNPDQDSYLIAWEDDRPGTPGWDIYGQVISGDGSLIGNDFVIATATDNQYDVVIGYHQNSQSYLAAWQDRRSGNYDVYGQAISGTGQLVGGNFTISTANNDQQWPAITALDNPWTANQGLPAEFLVVWPDKRASTSNPDIYGQRVSAGGGLLDEPDTPADETDPTVNIQFETSGNTERPAVAYSAHLNLALAAWNNRTDGGVYARRYSPSLPMMPIADFTTTPATGVVPLNITFTDISSGVIASREWDFGDGYGLSTSSNSPINHTYLTTGVFTVVLTATNPGGSSAASRQITVTGQITPALNEDFDALNLATDPLFWLDQKVDATGQDNFKVLWADPPSGPTHALGTTYSANSTVYSHYAIPGWAAWQNYEYRGRLQMTEPDGGIGLAFYSRYPANEPQTYALRRYAGSPESESFHLVGFGSTLLGDTRLDLTPQANIWYRFRVQIVTHPDRVTARAKMWAEGEAEPALWQADAYDDSSTRLTAGAVGVRTYGPGAKYFDELEVVPLTFQADFIVTPPGGMAPLTITATNYSTGATTYQWDFGDGGSSNLVTPTHTYTQAGSYSITLVANNGVETDTDVYNINVWPADLTGQIKRQWWQGISGSNINSLTSHPDYPDVPTGFDYQPRFEAPVDWGDNYGARMSGYLYPPVTGQYQFWIASDNASELWLSSDETALNKTKIASVDSSNWTGYQEWDKYSSQASAPIALEGGRRYYIEAVHKEGGGGDHLSVAWQIPGGTLEVIEGSYLSPLLTANFSAFPLNGTVPLLVQFLNNSAGATQYLWNFGDGTFGSTLVSPAHTYTQTGVYTVSLTAGSDTATDTLTKANYITVADLNQSLQGYWRLDETGGTRFDNSGNGNHLMDNNAVGSAPGQAGLAADFEVDNQAYLSIDHSLQTGLNITGSLTLAGWANFESSGNYMIMAAKYEMGAANNRAYRIGLLDTSKLQFILSPTGQYIQSEHTLNGNAALQAGAWYHIAAVFDAGAQTMTIYRDGQVDVTRSVAFNSLYASTAPFMLGGNLTDGNLHQLFDGQLDEWRVYNRALSQAEIQSLMSYTPEDEPVTGLIAINDSPTPLGQTTTLTATVISGANVIYAWDFGDSIESSGPVVTHTYPAIGNYTAVVTASNSANIVTATTTVTIADALTVIATHPANNDRMITSTGLISVTFNRTIDSSTVNTSTFTLWGQQRGVYTGIYTSTGNSVQFDPTLSFHPGEKLIVNLSRGIKAPDGIGLTPYAWHVRASVQGGSGWFADSGQRLGDADSYAVALGDLDRDGDLDAVIGNWDAANEVWFNDGAGHFSDSWQRLGDDWDETYTLALGDLDGDGDLDLFIGNGGRDQVWWNDGLGNFSDSGQRLGPAWPSRAVALGDLDGDGDLDAFVAHDLGEPNRIWWNNGSGQFTDSGQNLGSGYSWAVALGDLDGDGDLDALVIDNQSIGQFPPPPDPASRVWFNDGSGHFSPAGTAVGTTDSAAVALGDVDGDGDLDALIGDIFGGPARIWLNNGLGSLSDSGQSLATIWAEAVALGDLDGDGDPDAFIADYDSFGENGASKVWLNNGLGQFSDSGQLLDTAAGAALELGDVDGDGDLDAFVAASVANEVWLNQNLAIAKTGPAMAPAGELITYTLTVTNLTGTIAANLVITDTLPAGAGYITGGVQVGNVVSWTLSSLAAGEAISRSFVVTATETITNSDYHVSADGGISAVGQAAVTTIITASLVRDWHLITATLTISPPVIGEHALAYIPPLTSSPAGGQIILYGGNATGWPYETTTWEFDGTDWLTTTLTGPNARYGAQMGYLPGPQGGVILFGGSDESDMALAETWVYTNSSWSELQINGPLSRTYHSLATNAISNTLYVFGGNDTDTYFNDLWKYENGAWTELLPAAGNPPLPRTLAALTYDSANNRLLLFGGRTVTGTILADLWSFDLGTAQWSLLDPGGGGTDPPPRMAHSLTYDPALDGVVLVGGIVEVSSDTATGDTWHYDSGWTQTNPATPLPPRAYQQAVYTPAGIVVVSNGEVWIYE